MTKRVYGIFALCVAPSVVFGDVGTIDKRKYVDWNTAPYNKFVRICTSAGCGTGEFISASHILTSKKTAACCGVGASDCNVYVSDGTVQPAQVVITGGGLKNCAYDDNKHLNTGQDWAILALQDKTYVKQRVKQGVTGLKHTNTTQAQSGLQRAGFSELKVLNNEDIKNIKAAYVKWLKIVYPYDFIERNKVAGQGANLELGKYDIYSSTGKLQYNTFLEEFKKLTGKDFLREYLTDGNKLKAIQGCTITNSDTRMFRHTCSAWRGDSGSALINSRNEIVGIATESNHIIGDEHPDWNNIGVAMNRVWSDTNDVLSKPISATDAPNKVDVIYTRADGSQYLQKGGTRVWRNNNPGALEFSYQKDSGIIGRAYRFAVFPDEETGMKELNRVLRTDKYQSKTILNAMETYAPRSDGNNPVYYANVIAKRLGVGVNTAMSTLSESQLQTMAQVIQQMEGWYNQKDSREIKNIN